MLMLTAIREELGPGQHQRLSWITVVFADFNVFHSMTKNVVFKKKKRKSGLKNKQTNKQCWHLKRGAFVLK